MKAAFKDGAVDGCRRMLETKRHEWKTVPLNVAVIGNSGVGKSSFINAIRGLTADDEGAAAVGVKETTMEIRSYPHPDNPMMMFWDLPGVGTDKFPKETYLTDTDVDHYDFFLLMTADRFTENDNWLGNEFLKRNKKYFFVRTKIAVDIANNSKSHPKTHNEEAVIEEIRLSTEDHLRKNACEDVPVFLIDNYEPSKFNEFEKLKQRLIHDFPDLKRSALILSLQSTSEDIIKLKVAELKRRIKWCAALSAAAAATPLSVPGLSMILDVGIVAHEARFYYKQLGLDRESLKRCSRLYSADHEGMLEIMRKTLGIVTIHAVAVSIEVMTALVMSMVCCAVPSLTCLAAAEAAKFVPMIGGFLAAPASYIGTYSALTVILDMLQKTAKGVMKFVAVGVAGADRMDTAEEATDSEDALAKSIRSLCCE